MRLCGHVGALDDEEHAAADAALARADVEEILVPTLWWFEIRNFLVVAERRKRLTIPATTPFLQSVQRLKPPIDDAPEEAHVMLLARRHGLAVYDSGYLELALRAGVPLATLDKRLAAAARDKGVRLIG